MPVRFFGGLETETSANIDFTLDLNDELCIGIRSEVDEKVNKLDLTQAWPRGQPMVKTLSIFKLFLDFDHLILDQ